MQVLEESKLSIMGEATTEVKRDIEITIAEGERINAACGVGE